jgi:hypothetical protein
LASICAALEKCFFGDLVCHEEVWGDMGTIFLKWPHHQASILAGCHFVDVASSGFL